MSALSERHEAAILRTLRDIECGHITLRCSIRRFDPATGQRLAKPELEWTASDREPAAGYPRLPRTGPPFRGWWGLLVERGWIRLPTEWEPSRWQVTDEGRRVLAETNLSNDKE